MPGANQNIEFEGYFAEPGSDRANYLYVCIKNSKYSRFLVLNKLLTKYQLILY